MKLRYEALIIIGLTWVPFLIFNYFQPIRYSLTTFIILIVIFALWTFLLLRAFVINRIELLNQEVKKISEKTALDSHIHIKGNDELSSVAENINDLLDRINRSQKKTSENFEDRNQALEKTNIQLEQEIFKRRSIENELIGNRTFLTQVARYDEQTTLPNRIFFNEILNKTVLHAQRHHKVLAILLLDLSMTNVHSHREQIHKEITTRCTRVLRSEDILAKLDGDEFVVLLNDIGKAKFASTVAEKLLSVCSQPIKIDENEILIPLNIGICIYPKDGHSLEDLLKCADSALYKAKHAGNNNYQFYNQEMDLEAREYIQLESALRKAIHNNELALYYQPKLHLKKGSNVGIEALIRWEHPVLGIIDPSKFISIAEETSLIFEIGAWALREACKINKYWQDEGYEHLTVSVNLSPKQFYHPNLANIISSALNYSGLNPRYLEVEINEETIMGNIDDAANILEKIKSTGIQISIDHFGTGYTSISCLKKFPVSVLKIDQSFIKGVPNNPNDLAIISAFIGLAHNLGLVVVAEGVETAEQVQFLANQNCDIVQGYFLSHPLPAAKVIMQLKKLRDEVLI